MYGHDNVDLFPLNDEQYKKFANQLKEYVRIKEKFDNRALNPPQFPVTRDKDNKILAKLPRKPVASALLMRCHCLKIQWSAYSSTCSPNYDGDPLCPICRCACNFCWPIANTADIRA